MAMGKREVIAAYYSVYVFGSNGALLSRADGGSGRIYAPMWWSTWKGMA